MIKAIIFDAFGTLFKVTSDGSGFEGTDRIFVKNLFVMAHYQRLGLCREYVLPGLAERRFLAINYMQE